MVLYAVSWIFSNSRHSVDKFSTSKAPFWVTLISLVSLVDNIGDDCGGVDGEWLRFVSAGFLFSSLPSYSI